MKKTLAARNFYIIIFISLMSACATKGTVADDTVLIDAHNMKLQYVNFIPKKVDKVCLSSHIKKLIHLILDERRAFTLFSEIPSDAYYSKKYEKKRQEIEALSGKLTMQKHISYKGNHEWTKVTSSHYLRINDEKDALYIMYSMEPMVVILLDKPYHMMREHELITARWLNEPIDMHECIDE